ncbi:AlbA family DNA-binding domain-containing protein [Catenulispora rubra]|uniref:AlbA family DNA-binding domain-containing protein n=1 Tax=Catenulispora rubra TaxID=280293 RepID=UPI00189231C6|nr:ATP-binding protein [Catenulispora rubra]
MAVRLHRLTSRLGAELDELAPVHLQALCDLGMPEDVDLDFKSADAYTTTGAEGLDELAKDVTALANARGGLIVVGIAEDSQGRADSLSEIAVSDKKIGQMYSGLRARVVPYLPDVWISNVETANGSGTGYLLIAVPSSTIAPHAVRMTSRPQYSFARRVGRTTAWLEESEIAALYRDRFRLAVEHRDKVQNVLQTGSQWVRRIGPTSTNRIWLQIALVPSAPAERFIDPAHINGLSTFFREHSKPGVAPHPALNGFARQTPQVLRGRLRLEPQTSSTAMEAYADGCVYLRAEVGWPPSSGGTAPVLNFTFMEFWLLALLHAAAAYADWAGAYGDVDILADLSGPIVIIPSAAPLVGNFMPPFNSDARQRTDTEPVHATSTLEALAADAAQLLSCARRIASDLVADFGCVETTMLKPDGQILSGRLDPQAKAAIEHWMRNAGLPVGE